jgi:hypothetical protein
LEWADDFDATAFSVYTGGRPVLATEWILLRYEVLHTDCIRQNRFTNIPKIRRAYNDACLAYALTFGFGNVCGYSATLLKVETTLDSPCLPLSQGVAAVVMKNLRARGYNNSEHGMSCTRK